MRDGGGLWIALYSGKYADALKEKIAGNEGFRKTVQRSTCRPAAVQLCLLSLEEGMLNAFALARAGKKAGFDEQEVELSHFVSFKPLSLSAVLRLSKATPAATAELARSPHCRITPAVWDRIVSTIHSRAPSVVADYAGLKQVAAQIEGTAIASYVHDNSVLEKDAIALAGEIFGQRRARQRLLERPKSADDTAPFIQQLGGVVLREDAIIEHDLLTFPGFKYAHAHQVGTVELTNEFGEKLTIMNANRRRLEEAIGVDLIYWNHVFRSYIMVQYKRLTDNVDGVPSYRPTGDDSHDKALQQMEEVLAWVQAQSTAKAVEQDGVRLNDNPFYFKLRNANVDAPLDSSMMSGMYIPLHLWKCFLTSDTCKGPRGGIVFNWDNCSRRLSNSEFAKLFRSGWIGSGPNHLDSLTQLTRASIDGDKSLILAISSRTNRNIDYRRDRLGRFTEASDPVGST